ncbi:hypothetical protein PCL_05590 [Purpureocillium lilacinum]|uniref:Uncharacterized protein n=1 Tax=Purpureocillium lilacinum TaxID=33203 RepID=A0A2U3DUD6_PURLI|nr:hypothetical protein PCL_05590 [Purpureocillium lilacinum]
MAHGSQWDTPDGFAGRERGSGAVVMEPGEPANCKVHRRVGSVSTVATSSRRHGSVMCAAVLKSPRTVPALRGDRYWAARADGPTATTAYRTRHQGAGDDAPTCDAKLNLLSRATLPAYHSIKDTAVQRWSHPIGSPSSQRETQNNGRRATPGTPRDRLISRLLPFMLATVI